MQIVVPLGTSDAPNILNVDGQYKHNAAHGTLIWQQDIIDSSNSNGRCGYKK